MLNSVKKLSENPKNSGVYKITNIYNGRCYIGSSTNLRSRISVHKTNLNASRHTNLDLQGDWNLYGIDKFRLEILHYSDDPDELAEIERAMILTHDAIDYGYNLRRANDLPISLEYGAMLAARNAVYDRRVKLGLLPMQLWVHPLDHDAIKAFALKLAAKRTKSAE